MTKFTDNLWRDLVREHSATLVAAQRPEPTRRRRVAGKGLVGSTSLGLAGIGAALVLVLGGSSAPPAFAITTTGNGATLVTITEQQSVPQASAKLDAETGDGLAVQFAPGAATTAGAVTCKEKGSVSAGPVKVLVGKDGTETISPGESADNTGEGTFHVAACWVGPVTAGNSGPGTAGDHVVTAVRATGAGTANSGSGNTGNSGAAATHLNPVAVPSTDANTGNSGN